MTTATKKTAPNALTGKAYSHGFESIYAFETIDTSTIRVLNTPKTASKTSQEERALLEREPLEKSFAFFKEAIEPFFLRESIEILKLSSHAERYLRSLGYECVRDILDLDFNDMSFLKGLGQGHIEEIRTKIKEFIRGRSTKYRKCIDYISWARSCFSKVDKRVLGVVFERFGLMDLLPLSSGEKIEIKKLPAEKKQEWFFQFKETSQNCLLSFKKDLETVFEAFVRPWMLARCGFANEAELRELSWRLGEERETAEKVLEMFSQLFFDGAHPFTLLQSSVIPGIFVANPSSYKMASRIMKVLDSYFYDKNLQYDFEMLTVWIEREFACAWIALDTRVIKRVIELSKEYEIHLPLVGTHRTLRKV